MRFRVRLFDPKLATVREEAAEADSRDSLVARLEGDGVTVLSVATAATAPASEAQSSRKGGNSKLDVAWWCRELRTLVAAGMTVVEALETLNAQTLGQARAEVNSSLVTHLRQGSALSTAMQAVGTFPAVLVAGVKASERSSALLEALDEYLRYDEMLERLRKQVISAAIYPAVVVSLGMVITVFLLLFVIPRFSRMYTDLSGPVSWTTQALVGVSRTLNEHGQLVALALAGALVAVVFAWRTGYLTQLALGLAQRIEPLQRQIDQFRLAKLYQALALMFRGGYALDDALGQCATIGMGHRLHEAVQAAKRGLERGQRVSSAFGEAGLTDTVTQRLLATGERTGNFDRVLQTIAERHAANFNTFIERSTRVVEPLLLLLVALLVGGIVVMMYMPVFDMASSIR